jgi:hypothetical protein
METEDRPRKLEQLRQQLETALPLIEADQFMRCAVCGQFYDVRDFVEVWHHNEEPHHPLKADA